MASNTKKITVSFRETAPWIVLAFTVLGTIFFGLGFTTGYYIFGQMNSGIILALLLVSAAVELVYIFAGKKFPRIAKYLTYAVTAMLAAAAFLLIGDRVEGIGNCIVTDYDAGHGGEQAIYYSLAGSVAMLAGMIFNIVASFRYAGVEETAADAGVNVGGIASIAAAAVSGIAIVCAAAGLVGSVNAGGSGTAAGASGGQAYKISFNQANNNVSDMPHTQFLCSDLSGMLQADSRFYVDITLTLDGNGNYSLYSDAYVLENGARAEIGDATGLGLVLTTTAEGTYTDNGDGTVTTSPAAHAVFEMETDTYSEQMKGAAQMNVNGNDADGVYDSNDEPAVLDFVPETVWTLGDDGAITGYEAEGADDAQDADASASSGNSADEAVTSASGESAEGENAALLEAPSDDGATTMTFYGDGTYKFYFAQYDVSDEGTYTYEDGTLTLTDANGKETTAEGDPLKFTYAYSQSDQLTGDFTIAAADLESNASDEGNGENSGSADADKTELLEAPSDDGATTMTFYGDGTYKFYFAQYNVADEGTYTYEDGKLTVTDANGKETTAEGDPLKFTYAYSQSDQLTGDFTIAAADLEG